MSNFQATSTADAPVDRRAPSGQARPASHGSRSGAFRIARDSDMGVVSLGGRFDACAAESLENTLREISEGSDDDLVLDLSDVAYLGSAALRSLLLAARALAEEHRRLVATKTPDDVADILRLTGFDRVMTVR